MIYTRAASLPLTSQALSGRLTSHAALRLPTSLTPAACLLAVHQPSARRAFHASPARPLKEWFPPPEDLHKIRKSKPAWDHPRYSERDMRAVTVQHHTPAGWRDRVAHALMGVARFGMDTATRYSEKEGAMNERRWLVRIVFLESVAGVPGMVAGMLRHLRSLRKLKRDNGWIETLLEEAFNERMHLLTFLKLAQPGWFMKVMILGAQGVFFNGFFLAYLLSPRACHRFVGYLEEEAVHTYSHIIRQIEAGHLKKWADPNFPVPDIAVTYWNMPEGRRTMRDLMYYVRADEAKHREVNHTLGNLDQNKDPNPYTSEYKENTQPHPSKGLSTEHQLGWARKDVI